MRTAATSLGGPPAVAAISFIDDLFAYAYARRCRHLSIHFAFPLSVLRHVGTGDLKPYARPFCLFVNLSRLKSIVRLRLVDACLYSQVVVRTGCQSVRYCSVVAAVRERRHANISCVSYLYYHVCVLGSIAPSVVDSGANFVTNNASLSSSTPATSSSTSLKTIITSGIVIRIGVVQFTQRYSFNVGSPPVVSPLNSVRASSSLFVVRLIDRCRFRRRKIPGEPADKCVRERS